MIIGFKNLTNPDFFKDTQATVVKSFFNLLLKMWDIVNQKLFNILRRLRFWHQQF